MDPSTQHRRHVVLERAVPPAAKGISLSKDESPNHGCRHRGPVKTTPCTSHATVVAPRVVSRPRPATEQAGQETKLNGQPKLGERGSSAVCRSSTAA
eukprot:9503530-Pyramimonas_sp.AAC.1